MKNVLIISPYFPPTNAADMQRVRMSIPYFHLYDWLPEIVMVDERFSDLSKDELLLETVPENIKIHKVNAFSKKITSKFGLGSISLRSLIFYKRKVNRLIRSKNYDLIYFSTTQFPVCVLGSYWKKKFGIPYVIDFQDPWHSDFYQNKPKDQRPRKYWLSYRLNRFLEPIAMENVDGLISVSKGYIDNLKHRYPVTKNVPSSVITFGSFEEDLIIANKNGKYFQQLLDPDTINLVYVGRGGADMQPSIGCAFNAYVAGLERNPGLKIIKFYFLGTSYAANGEGIETIKPIAQKSGIDDQVVELTDRISFYHALFTLQSADALFIPGSEDVNYTASKIYPYISTHKPVLAVFNKQSPAIPVLQEFGLEYVFNYENPDQRKIIEFYELLLTKSLRSVTYNPNAVDKYSALEMARKQCMLFNRVLNEKI